MAKSGPEVPAPLVFRVERSADGKGFTWRLISPRDDRVLAVGGVYERRREAKEAIRLIAHHAAHAQLEDTT